MTDPIHQALALGQSIWYDGIRRSLLTSGDLERMVKKEGLRGMTSNPSDQAGDPACWAGLLCPGCGVILGDRSHVRDCRVGPPHVTDLVGPSCLLGYEAPVRARVT
jgi:hypothetical protein